MSFNDVKRLRQEGKLEEALKIALENLNNDPNNIWNKRSIAWVYYSLLKRGQENNNYKELICQLENIRKLELPKTEAMVFDSCAWAIGKFLFANNEVNVVYLDTLFSNIKNFEFTKPKDAYSFMLKGFKKHAVNWVSFTDFVNWWNLDYFLPTDYENFIMDNGTKISSLAEGVYIALSKQLLQNKDLQKIKDFIPAIAAVSKKYSNMQYPPYYYAKLLIALGDKEHFMEAFLPFAKKKSRDFWVWNLMSENFDRNSKEYFSCLCKSATCGAPDKFTGDVREKLADVFISKKQFAEAKHELSRIIDARNKEGWALRDKHIVWRNFAWWNNTDQAKNNFHIYNKNITIAESLLFADIPEEIIVVERVNKEKSVLNFIISKNKYGFASFRKYKIKPKVGDFYKVKFDIKEDDKSNFYKLLSIRVTDKKVSKEIYKQEKGILEIREGNSFGFVNNIFVAPQIITKKGLKNGVEINITALQSYNAKRKAWGWSVINIKNK